MTPYTLLYVEPIAPIMEKSSKRIILGDLKKL